MSVGGGSEFEMKSIGTMKGKGIYNDDSDDTNAFGGPKKQGSFLEKLEIAFRCFPSFCPCNHPEAAKNPALVPGVTALTGTAYAIGHASSFLAGAVSGVAGVGMWRVLWLAEDTNACLKEMSKDAKAIRKNLRKIMELLEAENATEKVKEIMEAENTPVFVRANKRYYCLKDQTGRDNGSTADAELASQVAATH